MKIAGIICLVIGVLNLVAIAITGIPRNLGGAIMFTVLGLFLISYAAKKKANQEKKDKFNNN
jgi:xanthine/uracil permease